MELWQIVGCCMFGIAILLVVGFVLYWRERSKADFERNFKDKLKGYDPKGDQ